MAIVHAESRAQPGDVVSVASTSVCHAVSAGSSPVITAFRISISSCNSASSKLEGGSGRNCHGVWVARSTGGHPLCKRKIGVQFPGDPLSIQNAKLNTPFAKQSSHLPAPQMNLAGNIHFPRNGTRKPQSASCSATCGPRGQLDTTPMVVRP